MTSTMKVPVPVAGSRIWTKGCGSRAELGQFQLGLAGHHLAPGDGAGQAVFNAEFGFQNLVHTAHDELHHGAGGVEHAALGAHGFVVGFEEVFVKVNDRVVARLAGIEAAQHRVHGHFAQHGHHFVDAQFIKVHPLLAVAGAACGA
jgi:hypothetical protein